MVMVVVVCGGDDSGVEVVCSGDGGCDGGGVWW